MTFIFSLQELEKEELIFLDGNEDKRIKLPFLTLHEIYSHRNLGTLPAIKILESLDNAISSDQNERLTISVLVFRLWAIYHRSISDGVSDPCSFQLSQLVPLRRNQKDMVLKFSPVFTVNSTYKQINEKNWDKFVKNIEGQSPPKCIAYQNLQNTPFADSFLLTKPPILIQDKQQVASRKKVIAGRSPNMLEKGLIEKEHNKCKSIGKHIFLFVTDSKKRNDETYKENEVLITEEEKKIVFGDLLALRKLHCIERA